MDLWHHSLYPLEVGVSTLDLVKHYKTKKVSMNLETKVEAGAPNETVPREEFVQILARQVGMLDL